jgi:phenylalanyl-tRNA synthetase alpha chain
MTATPPMEQDFLNQIAAANDLAALESVRLAALGKKGQVTEALKALGALPPDERKTAGAALNVIRDHITSALSDRERVLKTAALSARLATETVDITLPARAFQMGKVHPITRAITEMTDIFSRMGFTVAEGPDIEDDFHNFTALNFPPGHPAREMHDTFYLPDDMTEEGEHQKKLLRTHTSTIQIRHLLKQKPPAKIICFGRVYRAESDMTHSPMFHQMEALYIDKNVTMAHLKGCLTDFCRAFFEVEDLPVRFRPSYFPFTEPSAEMDIGCSWEGGSLKIGAGASWLEILGSGMVHPNVIRNCGLDPSEYQGFAFGAGLDRLAMLKYGIPDLRDMFEGDPRWIQHFGG